MDRYHTIKSYFVSIDANNCKAMVLRAPHDTSLAMVFGFPITYGIGEFLQKINLPHLLEHVSYWQGLKFKFKVHGIDSWNYFVDKEVVVDFDGGCTNLAEIADKLRMSYNYLIQRENILDPKVSRLFISC